MNFLEENTTKMNKTIFTAQYKTANSRNETGQKRIERKGSNETAVHELCDTGEHNVKQISVDQFQFFRCIVYIFIVEFDNNGF